MSGGAFRDASAAIERAAMLEQENEQLRSELGDVAKLRVELEELEGLRAEVAALRATARAENEDAFVRRLSEQRDELEAEVRTLRDRLATQERELTRRRFAEVRRQRALDSVEPVIERLVGYFRKK